MPKGRPKSENLTDWQIIQLRVDPDTQDGVDDMRREEKDLPSRTEMVRRIVIQAVAKNRAQKAKVGK